MVCCGYIVCFTPYEMLVVVSYNIKTIDFGSWYFNLLTMVMFSNSIINPFIYAAKYRDFQHGARRLISKLKQNQQQPRVTAVTSQL